MKIKLLLVEDHHIVRRGLVFFLKTREEFEIVGEAENGEDALTFVQTKKARCSINGSINAEDGWHRSNKTNKTI